jgi:diacylglycerol kinase
MDYWSFVLAGLGLLQLWMSGSHLRTNSLVGGLTSVGWFFYGVQFQQWGFLISASVFLVVHVRNYVRWSK